MPYYKRKQYSYKGQQRYKYYKTKRPRWGRYDRYAGKKALQMAGKALSLLNVEHKYHDVSSASSALTYNGTLTNMNAIAQGDTDVTRDGDSLKMVGLKFSGNVKSTANAIVRIIIFNDKQNVLGAVGNYLQPAYVGTANAVDAPKHHDKRFQSNTLLDMKLALSANGSQIKQFNKFIKLGLHTQYDAGSTTVVSGALKMITITDLVTGPTIEYIARLTYIDN